MNKIQFINFNTKGQSKHKTQNIPSIAETVNRDHATFKDMTDFFSIKDTDYFKQALYDAIGLYSLMNWKGDTHETYNNASGNIVQENAKDEDPDSNYKDNFKINSEHVSSYSKNKYSIVGIFYKNYSKTQIFKKVNTSEYLVFFKWGDRSSLYTYLWPKILNKTYEFILSKLENPSKVLLFGFSMGGNIAQHIALHFIENKSANNVYLVSLGIGGTLSAADKTKLERGLYGQYISVALMKSDNPEPNNFKGDYNDYILPDTDTDYKTIKSIFLNTKYDSSYTETNTVYNGAIIVKKIYDYETYTLQKIYDYDNYKENFGSFDMYKSDRNLHDFKLYRLYLHMLITGISTTTIKPESK